MASHEKKYTFHQVRERVWRSYGTHKPGACAEGRAAGADLECLVHGLQEQSVRRKGVRHNARVLAAAVQNLLRPRHCVARRLGVLDQLL